VRGAAHIGVLSVLEEAGIRADVVAGTSVGAIIGAAYAAGMTAAEMFELMKPLKLSDVARVSVRSRYSLLDTTPLAEFIETSLEVRTFDDLQIPFAAVAADVVAGREVVIREGEVARAVMASAAIPAVFPPVEEGEALLVDGGTFNLVPVGVARDLGAEYVVSVDLNPGRVQPTKPKNAVDLLLASYELMQRRISDDAQDADVYLAPQVGEHMILDFSNIDELYEKGRAVALEHVDRIAEDLGA
jgi:NTE family protein